MFNRITPAIKNLIIINVLMWLATIGFPNLKLDEYLGLFYYQSTYFHYYQYITYMFMHGGFFHILLNMWALFMFGTVLENVWGSKRFIIFYFVTGVGAALFYTLINHFQFMPMIKAQHAFINTPSPELFKIFVMKYSVVPDNSWINFFNNWMDAPKDPLLIKEAILKVNYITYAQHLNIPCVGASGAIYGILLGFAMLFPNTRIVLLFPPIPLKAKYFVLIFGGVELYYSISQSGDNIAHVAHLGGMLFGYFMIKLWSKSKHNFY